MSATLLDGSALAKELRAALKEEAAAFAAQHGFAPALAVLRVGGDPASGGYARAIEKLCKNTGLGFRAVELGDDAAQADAQAALAALNGDPAVHGIMILEPVPATIDHAALVDSLDPAKDVDGVHPLNAGRLSQQKEPCFVPATPAGGILLLERAGVEFKGKHAVMVGRSDIVGKPMALLLLHRHCTVTIAHSRTRDLDAVCRTADILCVGVGRKEMVEGSWIKPGAAVVDFGTNYKGDQVFGDVAQAEAAEVAGLLTPVPGGTGPVTNAMLAANVLQAARWAVEKS